MGNVFAERPSEVALSENEQPIEKLGPCRFDQRLATAFARGARTGVLMILIPSVRKISSKAAVNFVSRSWMRKRKSLPVSASAIERFLACWVTQALFGRAVQPAR